MPDTAESLRSDAGKSEGDEVGMGFCTTLFEPSLPSGRTMQGNMRVFSTALIVSAVTMVFGTSASSTETNGKGNLHNPPKSPVAKRHDVVIEGKSQSSIPQYILALRTFSIPFTVDHQDAASSEVRLYVLPPGKDAWMLHSSVPIHGHDRKTTVKKFSFIATEDGVYQFATRTADARDRELPIEGMRAEIAVVVDTVQPQLILDVEPRVNGEISVVFEAIDDTALQGALIRYATDIDPQWETIESEVESDSGKVIFKAADRSKKWTYASVEFTATDAAGNTTRLVRQVRRPRLATEVMRMADDVTHAGHGLVAELSTSPSSDPERAARRENQASPFSELTRKEGTTKASLAGFQDRTGSPESEVHFGNQALQESGDSINDSRALELDPPQPIANSGLPNFTGLEDSSDAILLAPSMVKNHEKPLIDNDILRIAQLGDPPRRPASLFEKLFGITPPENPVLSTNRSRFTGTGTESAIRADSSIQARLVGNPQELLPPPASPAQISEGFTLNEPQQNSPTSGENRGSVGRPPSNASRAEVVPETLPPQGSQGLGASAAQSPIANRKVETPAQAMRPIGELSQVVPLLKEQTEKNNSRSEISEENQVLPIYEAKRSEINAESSEDSASKSLLSRVPVRFSKGKRFSLDYELEAIGLQGAESIELYGTTDSGKTWQLWGSDPDRQSPFDIETQDAGAFGFRICVVGRNGLASPRPLSGEMPDIFVVVDTEKPQVRITGAQYGQGSRVGSLVITYECSDDNLAQRPITLAFSDSSQGPWTTIVGGLRNEGQYIWAADPNLPRQLYLRIDVVDEAGNRGVYLLDQPIDTQGLAPRAKIRGFQPLSRGGTSSQTETTASRNQIQF